MSTLFYIPHWATKWPKAHWVIKGINWGYWGLRHYSKLTHVMGTRVSLLNNSIILCIKFWLGIIMKMNYRAGSWCASPGVRMSHLTDSTLTADYCYSTPSTLFRYSSQLNFLTLRWGGGGVGANGKQRGCLQVWKRCHMYSSDAPLVKVAQIIPFLNRYNISLQM